MGRRLSNEDKVIALEKCKPLKAYKFPVSESIVHSTSLGLMWSAYSTYMRSPESLALMNLYRDISVNIGEIINSFATKHPRPMKLNNISKD